MPAMKAPNAKLRPASSVIQAKPNVTKSRFKTNNSSLLRLATNVNHQRMAFWPPVMSKVIKTAALPAASSKDHSMPSAGAPNAGIITIKGTTAKSWNSNTPITRLPCSDSSSKRSASNLTTIAVLLIAMALAKVKAVCHSICQSVGAMVLTNKENKVTMNRVRTTCNRPKPKTCWRMERNLGKLNSSPMTNIRNTTPNSAKCLTPAEF